MDGTQYVFNNDQSQISPMSNTGLLAQIIYPSGETLTITYAQFNYSDCTTMLSCNATGYRRQSIASNTGYRLHTTNSSTTGTTQFLYDGSHIIAEYNSSGAVTNRYVFGPGGDEPLVWYMGSGTTTPLWTIADNRGSIIAVTNASGTPYTSGSSNGINIYDDYGVPASTNLGRFQYTGQAWVPETALYHYKARTYNPTLGRFLQTDPAGYSAGMNLYAYVGNDPINNVDPTGMCDDDTVCVTGQSPGGGSWADGWTPLSSNMISSGNGAADLQKTVSTKVTGSLIPQKTRVSVYTISINGTTALFFGISGAVNFSYIIPDGSSSVLDDQISGSAQVNFMAGGGGFLGWGGSIGYGRADYSDTGWSTSVNGYAEGDLGLGPLAVGASASFSTDLGSPLTQGSFTPAPKFGFGAGAYIGYGGSYSLTYTTSLANLLGIPH